MKGVKEGGPSIPSCPVPGLMVNTFSMHSTSRSGGVGPRTKPPTRNMGRRRERSQPGRLLNLDQVRLTALEGAGMCLGHVK
jgi:hypothetical protein